jgi:site-specific DNA-methyltransferase (adenine-specific)
MNTLFYGDNLDVLREHIKSESVDLVYLDPPFNSNRNYNVLFAESDASDSDAQIHAFQDTWHWDQTAEGAFRELTGPEAEDHHVPARLVTLMEALRSFLGQNDMMAYLVMMAVRLVELRRVLKPTGSLYLHCDPTASHYLKLVLDGIFGPERFISEITWQRTTSHGDAKRWSPVSDTILFYSKSEDFTWNPVHVPHSEEYVASKYRHDDGDGRLYRLDNMTSPNPRPNMMYEWKGHEPPEMGWRYSRETMQKHDDDGRIWYPDSKDKRPQFKRYLDEMSGTVIGNVWTDIAPLNSQAQERLGYPTQKPLALMERIISASSNKGDVVLDPFCGCGTTVHASQRLERQWIGIDITHLAIALIRSRLESAFPGIEYETRGEPADLAGARKLAADEPYQFQWWALHLIGARPVGESSGRVGKKGMDRGIDGVIRFRDDPKVEKSQRVIVSVKAGKNITSGMVRDLVGTVDSEGAPIGVFFTMHEPTAEMRAAAVKAGMYHSKSWGRDYPRIQIITVEEAFAGKRVDYPGMDVTMPEAPTDRIEKGSLTLPGVNAGVIKKPGKSKT